DPAPAGRPTALQHLQGRPERVTGPAGRPGRQLPHRPAPRPVGARLADGGTASADGPLPRGRFAGWRRWTDHLTLPGSRGSARRWSAPGNRPASRREPTGGAPAPRPPSPVPAAAPPRPAGRWSRPPRSPPRAAAAAGPAPPA